MTGTAWELLPDGAPAFALQAGSIPMLAHFPQSGRGLPAGIAAQMTPSALQLPDTSWQADALWEPARRIGCAWMMPAFSRYVVDLNRQPDPPAVPIANTTPLCAAALADGTPIYRDGRMPSAEEIEARVARFWRPYHDALAATLGALAEEHGRALLLDAHTIHSDELRFLGRRPPDVAIMTGGGRCCTPRLRAAIEACTRRHSGLSIEVDRSPGGGVILHLHSDAARQISAIQVEVRQDLYLPAGRLEPVMPRPELAAFIDDLLDVMAAG